MATDSYSGPAIAGERGRELWGHNGSWTMVDQPSLIDVGPNDIIIPNRFTEELMQSQGISKRAARQTIAGYQLADNQERYRSNQAVNWNGFPIQQFAKVLTNELGKLPFNHSTFDERGVTDFIEKQGTRVINRNKRHGFTS